MSKTFEQSIRNLGAVYGMAAAALPREIGSPGRVAAAAMRPKAGAAQAVQLLHANKAMTPEFDAAIGALMQDVDIETPEPLPLQLHGIWWTGYHAAQATSRPETPKERYDRQHRVLIGLNLNRRTDSDILQAVEGKAKQTELKRLIRLGLEQEQEQ